MEHPGSFTSGAEPIVVSRIPYLPWDAAESLLQADDPEDWLRTFLSARSDVVQAIHVASPVLASAITAWLDGSAPRNRRMLIRIAAYILRMSTRTTPFGLFSSVGEVRVGTSTNLEFEGRWTRSRLDMGVLAKIVRQCESDPAIRSHMRVVPNGHVIRRGGRVIAWSPERSTAGLDGKPVSLDYEPVSIRNTPLVEQILEWAKDSPTVDELSTSVAEVSGVDKSRAEQTVLTLWIGGFLISTLRPSPIDDPVGRVLKRLPIVALEARHVLGTVAERLRVLDSVPIQKRVLDDYNSVGADIEIRDVDSRKLYQVDMGHIHSGTLDVAVLNDVAKLAEWWLRSNRPRGLRRYRSRFLEKYESEEIRVPLLELVDDSLGIGPPPNWVELGEDFSEERRRSLSELATRAYLGQDIEVSLTSDELNAYLGDPISSKQLLRSFEIGFEIAAESKDDIGRGDYRIVPALLASTGSAASSIGRFADMLGDSIVARTKEVIAESAPAGAVNVELVYFPGSGRANVCVRPPICDHSINFGLTDGAHAAQIPLDDILIGLRDERFVAWSRSLQRELRIVENHVMNPEGATSAACHLLTLLSLDGTVGPVGFDWGPALMLQMRPRLRVERIVISPASWSVPKSLFDGDIEEARIRFSEWRRRWRVPDRVFFVDSDHRIAIDFVSKIGWDVFEDQLRSLETKTISLQEILPAASSLWMSDGAERYKAEFVASFMKTQLKDAPVPVVENSQELRHVPDDSRHFGLGSQWIYAKIYCGAREIDRVLLSAIDHLGETFLDSEGPEWFFVRYADPFAHVRLRVRAINDRAAMLESVIWFCESLKSSGMIHRYSFDTYSREIERYGGVDTYELAESAFRESSLMSLLAIREVKDLDERVLRTIVDFDALALKWLSEAVLDGVLNSLRPKPRRLSKREWEAVRSLQQRIIERRAHSKEETSTAQFLLKLAELPNARPNGEVVRSLLHMHCNRMGIASGEEERGAMDLLWHTYNGLMRRSATGRRSLGVVEQLRRDDLNVEVR